MSLMVGVSRLDEMVAAVTKEKLVLDLSCRVRDGKYFVVTDKWQTFTDFGNVCLVMCVCEMCVWCVCVLFVCVCGCQRRRARALGVCVCVCVCVCVSCVCVCVCLVCVLCVFCVFL